METYDQMLARHQQQMLDLLETQRVTWNILTSEYGQNLPPAILAEWHDRYGNTRLHGMRAQHEAERESHPRDPLSYRYIIEEEQQAKFEAYQKQQQEKAEQSPEESPKPAVVDNSVFMLLHEEYAKKQQEPNRDGWDFER